MIRREVAIVGIGQTAYAKALPGTAWELAIEAILAALDDADLRGRGIFVTVDDPGRGQVTIPGYPVKLSRSPARVAAPPQPGQHTAEVLRDWLGADAAAVESSLGHRGAEGAP